LEQSSGQSTHQQRAAYCSKVETRVAGPWVIGALPAQGKRSDYIAARNFLKEHPDASINDILWSEDITSHQSCKSAMLIRSHRPLPKRREAPLVYWCHGATGGGKTRWAFEMAESCKVEPWVSTMELNNFLNGYDEHKFVIIDDFRSSTCKFSWLLRLLDRYPLSVNIKFGSARWVPEVIVITCPYHPKYSYKRFEEHNEDLTQLIRRITEIRLFGEEAIPTKPFAVAPNFVSLN